VIQVGGASIKRTTTDPATGASTNVFNRAFLTGGVTTMSDDVVLFLRFEADAAFSKQRAERAIAEQDIGFDEGFEDFFVFVLRDLEVGEGSDIPINVSNGVRYFIKTIIEDIIQDRFAIDICLSKIGPNFFNEVFDSVGEHRVIDSGHRHCLNTFVILDEIFSKER
jgi:hypothetical protein